MKKQWLAVINDNNLIVAHLALKKNKLKIFFLDSLKLEENLNDYSSQKESNSFDYIKNWFRANKIPCEKLKLTVSSLGLVTRVVSLPLMSRNDLEKLVNNQISQYFTIDIENYIIDYKILNKYYENKKPMINVLLAALPKQKIASIWSICQYLGFEPRVIDLSADCLTRIYSTLAARNKLSGDMVIVSLSENKVEFVLLNKGIFFLYSDLEIDLKAIAAGLTKQNAERQTEGNSVPEESMQAELEIASFLARTKEFVLEDLYIPKEKIPFLNITESDLDPAQKIKHSKQLMYSKQSSANKDEDLPAEYSLNPLIAALAGLLSIYETSHYGKKVSKIYLTGEYCFLPYVPEIMSKNLGIDTVVGFPGWDPKIRVKNSKLSSDWPKYGSLYGLALRED
ncbi:MAG: pilus assembly protein PilM [Peptococcaceae bacterium]|nr:pilus assembly protein PilM [Peptococcaceae bacterium]